MADIHPKELSIQTLNSFSFEDLKGEIDKTVEGLITAINFIKKISWFIPSQYTTSLDELLRLLTLLNDFLDKMP